MRQGPRSKGEDVTRIECLGCGHVLPVPDSVGEGAEFACAHCGLVMLNVAAARHFRWGAVDPYVRSHGASPANLWGGLAGAALWLPVLAIVLAVKDMLDAAFIAALALPYFALLAVVARKRARTPAMLWLAGLWMGLGAYALYVGALLALRPDWAALLTAAQATPLSGGFLERFGAVAVCAGAIGAALYLRKAHRVPRVRGEPPAADARPGTS